MELPYNGQPGRSEGFYQKQNLARLTEQSKSEKLTPLQPAENFNNYTNLLNPLPAVASRPELSITSDAVKYTATEPLAMDYGNKANTPINTIAASPTQSNKAESTSIQKQLKEFSPNPITIQSNLLKSVPNTLSINGLLKSTSVLAKSGIAANSEPSNKISSGIEASNTLKNFNPLPTTLSKPVNQSKSIAPVNAKLTEHKTLVNYLKLTPKLNAHRVQPISATYTKPDKITPNKGDYPQLQQSKSNSSPEVRNFLRFSEI